MERLPDTDPYLDAVLPTWHDPDVIAAFAAWHPFAVAFYRPATDALIAEAGIREGMRVLDIGTGSGIPAVIVAEVVGPNGEVVAADPSDQFLHVAEENARQARLGTMSVRRAVAESLPFDDGRFDAVVSQLGMMFVSDLPRALTEVRRVLRPGGRAAFMGWGPPDQNPFFSRITEVAARYTPKRDDATPPAPPDPRQPFRFAPAGTLTAAMNAAGFAGVREQAVPIHFRLPAIDAFLQFWLGISATYRSLDEAQRTAFRDETVSAYREFESDRGFELPAVMVIGSGSRR